MARLLNRRKKGCFSRILLGLTFHDSPVVPACRSRKEAKSAVGEYIKKVRVVTKKVRSVLFDVYAKALIYLSNNK